MSDSLMVGLWDRITVYCLNHDEPIQMEIVKNTEKISSPFYGCSQYFPEKVDPEKGPCPNRLNLDDYQGIVLKFCDFVAEEGATNDYTNFTFTYKGGRHKTFVKVLKYSDKEIRLGILNKTILGA